MDSSKVIITVLVAVFLITAANAANILCLMGAATATNQIRSHVLFKALAARGHKLTVVGEAEYITKLYGENVIKGPYNNILYRHMSIPSSPIPSEYDRSELVGTFKKTMMWNGRQWNICVEMLSSRNFHYMIKWSQNKTRPFDLIIYDIIHAPDCLLSLAQLFDRKSPEEKEVPMVAMNIDAKTIPETFEVARGGLINYAKVPFFLSNFNENLTMAETYFNLVNYGYAYLSRCISVGADICQMTLQHPHLKKVNLVYNYSTIKKRIKIVFVNSHPLLNFEQPAPPNVIQAAGWQITHPKALPQELLDDYVEKSNLGIIFMSFGDSFRIDIPAEQLRVRGILNVVRLLPEFVFLWKVENGETIANPPANLYMSKNLSVNDVLAHRKTKIFITVAEIMNLQEAIHYGVPMIVVPLLIDQLNLARRIHDRGIGAVFQFEFEYFDESRFHNVLTGILKEYNKFKSITQEMKSFFRKQSEPALDTVIWYVEALLANPKRFDNLVSETGQPSFFIKHFFDVLPITIYFIFYISLHYLMCRYFVMNKIANLIWIGLKPDLEKIRPVPEDIALEVEDIAPEAEDIAHEPENTAPVSEDTAPIPEDAAIEAEDGAPEPENTAPVSEDIAPEAEDVGIEAEDGSLESENTAPVPDHIAPEAGVVAIKDDDGKPENTAAEPENIAPDSEDVAIEVEDGAPRLENTAPEPEKHEPEIEDISPQLGDFAFQTENTEPKLKDIASEAKNVTFNDMELKPKEVQLQPAQAHVPSQYLLDNEPSTSSGIRFILYPPLPPNFPPPTPQSKVQPKKKKGKKGKNRK